MGRQLQTFHTTTHVPGVSSIEKIIDAGMDTARRPQNSLCFELSVRLPDILDIQDRQHYAFGIAERNFAASGIKRFGKRLGHIERDRYWPERAAAQFHLVAYAVVIPPIHKAAQR